MTSTRIEGDVKITTSYRLNYDWRDCDGGFAFDCDKDGNVDRATLHPTALLSLNRCVLGEYRVHKAVVTKYEQHARLCHCGSQLEREAVHDARNIFLCYVCKQCKADKLAKYRPEILTDSQYDTMGEQVEPLD